MSEWACVRCGARAEGEELRDGEAWLCGACVDAWPWDEVDAWAPWPATEPEVDG